MAAPRTLGAGTALYDTQRVYTDPGLAVGTPGVLDGRGYVWCSHTGSASLTRGEPLVSAPMTETENLATTTAALTVGRRTVEGITATAAAVAANFFQGGYLMVVDGGGEGTAYRIRDHTAFTASTADGILTLEHPIEVAGDANTEVTLIQNKYANPVRSKGAGQDPFVGVPNVTVPAGNTTTQYFWAQRVGYCPTFVEGTPKRGVALVVANRANGRLEGVQEEISVVDSRVGGGRTLHELDRTMIVGQMATDAIDGEVQVVDLQNPLF